MLYAALGVLLLGIVSWFVINFAHDETTIGKAEIVLDKYDYLQTEKNLPLKENLNNLAKLNKVASELDKKDFWQHFMPDATEDKQLQAKLENIYNQSEQRLVIPAMQQSLALFLKNYNSVDPALLYRALRTYLSLNQPQHFNKDYAINTMQILWKNVKNKKQMLAALNHALDNPQPIRLNNQLISNVRQALGDLPKPALGFVILSSGFPDNMLTLNLSNDKEASKLFTFSNPNIGISSLYTLDTLRSLNKDDFIQAANTALHGNWVLTQGAPSSQPTEQLAKQLEDIYLKNYANNWLGFINNLKLRQFDSIDKLNEALALLSSQNSPLSQLFTLIEKNITQQAVDADPQFNQLISSFSSSSQQLNNNLTQLQNYLASANSPEQAFNQSKQRILNQGINDPISNLITFSKSLPRPLGYWAYQLAQNAWQLMLSSTLKYINQTWNSTVYQDYKNQIQNRFPFNPYATTDVSLNSFVNFFASTGVLQKFFDTYLQDFINTNQSTWRPIALDGLQLQLKNETLALFQRAANIRQTFFPMQDQSLFIPFTLQAQGFSKNLTSLTFQLGKQSKTFTKNSSQAAGFKWPDSNNKILLRVVFNEQGGLNQLMTVKGPWAMWQLLRHTYLKPVAGKKNQWLGSLIDSGHQFKFKLTTKQATNPFSLLIFENFELSDSL